MKTTGKQTINTKSGHIKYLLIAAALVAVLVTSLYFANKTSTPANNTTDTQTTQPTTQLLNTQPDPKQPVEDPNYLVIKEWGVRFKLPVELQGDVYYVFTSDGRYATFGSKEYDILAGLCKPENGGIYKILRFDKNDKSVDPAGLFKAPGDHSYDVNKDSFKIIGEFAYFEVPRSYGCLDVGQKTAHDKEILIRDAVINSLEVM
jgi:hypothetical protein